MKFRILSQGIIPSEVEMVLPTSVNIIKVIPSRWDQRSISQVILDYVQLIIVANHHSKLLGNWKKRYKIRATDGLNITTNLCLYLFISTTLIQEHILLKCTWTIQQGRPSSMPRTSIVTFKPGHSWTYVLISTGIELDTMLIQLLENTQRLGNQSGSVRCLGK